jgi:hypothetical protein
VRFGIFYEHQLPRPWQPGSEHKLFRTEAAERAKTEHLAPAVEAALARREPAREAPDTVLVPTPGF